MTSAITLYEVGGSGAAFFLHSTFSPTTVVCDSGSGAAIYCASDTLALFNMWYYYLAAILAGFLWFLLRPRSGGKNSPPLVTTSSVVPIPLVGVIFEFLKTPTR